MEIAAKINRQKKTLVIEIPIQRATPSATGKTLVVATTHGCKTTKVRHSGHPVVVTANAFFYPEKKRKKHEAKEE